MDELAKGIEIEKEHSDTVKKIWEMGRKNQPITDEVYAMIAKDHLREASNYYTLLVAMESKFPKKTKKQSPSVKTAWLACSDTGGVNLVKKGSQTIVEKIVVTIDEPEVQEHEYVPTVQKKPLKPTAYSPKNEQEESRINFNAGNYGKGVTTMRILANPESDVVFVMSDFKRKFPDIEVPDMFAAENEYTLKVSDKQQPLVRAFFENYGWVVEAARMTHKPEKIKINDLLVSFNEKFHDSLVYTPWADGEYVTQVGTFSLGFGEKPYLESTLEKVKKQYGEEIGTGLITSEPIPHISSPLKRRHGSDDSYNPDDPAETISTENQHRVPLNKFIFWKKYPILDYVDLREKDLTKTNQDIVKALYEQLNRNVPEGEKPLELPNFPSNPDVLPEDASYVRGVSYFNPKTRKIEFVIQEEHNVSESDIEAIKRKLSTKFTETKKGPLKFIVPGHKKIRFRVLYPIDVNEEEALYEKQPPYAANWEDFSGTDNPAKDVNDREFWRPLHNIIEQK